MKNFFTYALIAFAVIRLWSLSSAALDSLRAVAQLARAVTEKIK